MVAHSADHATSDTKIAGLRRMGGEGSQRYEKRVLAKKWEGIFGEYITLIGDYGEGRKADILA